MQLSDEEWRQKLTPEQYHVLREQGTEAPFSGDLVNETRDGMYACAACGAELFTSDQQYESKLPGLTGWPSFADDPDSPTGQHYCINSVCLQFAPKTGKCA